MDDWLFYLIAGATFLFSLAVRKRLMATYARYRRVPNRVGLAGFHVARRILDAYSQFREDLAAGRIDEVTIQPEHIVFSRESASGERSTGFR